MRRPLQLLQRPTNRDAGGSQVEAKLFAKLASQVDDAGQLTTGITPSNIFARVVDGEQPIPADVTRALLWLPSLIQWHCERH